MANVDVTMDPQNHHHGSKQRIETIRSLSHDEWAADLAHKSQNPNGSALRSAISLASGNQTHFIDVPSAAAYGSAMVPGSMPPVKLEISLAMGNPGPLGLYGFAMTTFMLSFVNAAVSEKAYIWWVVPYALCYGGAIQLLAGLLEFFKKNTLAGVAFSSYGGFWIGFGIYLLTLAGGVVPAESNAATKTGHAIYMAYWGLFSFTMFAASFKTNRTLQLTFFFVGCTFFCLLGGVYDPKSEKAGGVFGILGAFFAFYTGSAALLKDVYGFDVLPVGEYKPPKEKS
mmetsp:Transcript_5999/g.10284  ORF Transcript_5999/g.10284 Transcript_5999/m.10284 type:complete len:284 (-) Transcript_5999:894-1745(-)